MSKARACAVPTSGRVRWSWCRMTILSCWGRAIVRLTAGGGGPWTDVRGSVEFPAPTGRTVDARRPRAPHLRAGLAVARPHRRHRARHAARAPGHGLRRARRAAADHGAVHDGRLPRRLRPRRAVADPRPRPGFVPRADDRGDDPAARRRQPGAGDRAGRDARAPRRADHRRRRRRPSSASSPTCSRTRSGPATWPASRSSSSSASCPSCSGSPPTPSGLVAEVGAFLQGLDQTNPWALGIGLLSLGIILGLKRVVAADARHPRRRRRLDRAVDRARPRGARRVA